MSRFEYLLRLGDNALILSHRLGEWCGHAPALEEDIAMANIALDLLGQARLWLSYAGEIEGRQRDEDRLTYHRDAPEFRNVLLVEQPNGLSQKLDFGQTMARQFLFDTWHSLLLERLCESQDKRIRAIAEKSVKEVAYHLRRSTDWIVRLGDGTDESHARIQEAIDGLWRYTGELFETDEVDKTMMLEGTGCDPAALLAPWTAIGTRTFSQATLRMPSNVFMQKGGKRGVHTEALGFLLAEMQYLQKTYPGAQW
jgi:ring-1,2-phenylacetyl-CoA epoxidase subunit PaaC